MKQFIYLILLGLILSSCDETIVNYNETVVIISRESSNDIICKFTTSKFDHDFSKTRMTFMDSCQKFKVGDTLKLTK